MLRLRASAPGKCILMGEHAAVYGRPALVTAVDRRTTAELSELGTQGFVRLRLPQVGVCEEVAWAEIRRYTRRCREAWEAYREEPGPEAFRRLRGADPAHLVKIALGEAADHLGDAEPPAVAVAVESTIPVGAGFGSSAAVAVAVTAAYLALRGAEPGPDELHRLTLEVERRQHGLPSGIDNATVIHGGLVWAERGPDDLAATPLGARPALLDAIRVVHSGEPAESTGDVVARVRSRMEAEPERYRPLLGRMEEATRALRRELEGEPSSSAVIELFRDFEGCLEELGVVPAPVRELARRIEDLGGAAKISGAGTLSGRGAGSLLVYHPDGGAIEGWDFLDGLEPLDLRLGAEGVRLDPTHTNL